MAMDTLDYAAVVGFAGLVIATRFLEGVIVAAALGGFVLSLSLWRLHAGRPWEALGWLVWVGTAVILALGPAGRPVLLVAFIGSMLLGVGLLFGGRMDLLPDIWTLE
ncbi:hypothetical protein OB955_11725 [Halobacteria archaeon AArc-m2/3/4]|uniref:Uncharacterized protein n=1 Tax=Natronoglomus mannanivorans TaxID=2979990 RepID=A0AAP2YZ69_9EURY|nr:hypothetical protein [Halobacteria archaeon AArc-xg1-1]MCU4973409.1 hypothetical protein [Halobacteria archaeon AArc-m2/3/4]